MIMTKSVVKPCVLRRPVRLVPVTDISWAVVVYTPDCSAIFLPKVLFTDDFHPKVLLTYDAWLGKWVIRVKPCRYWPEISNKSFTSYTIFEVIRKLLHAMVNPPAKFSF